ncbi:asparagine synthase (glutamine-hydrolyzing) [Aliikangiella sp. IMCC44653]
MCGFSGFFDYNNETELKNQTLKYMGEALEFRGPDEESFYNDDYLSFVFRRLAIVDIKSGSQPIWNEDNSIFVAVNGEIYNHMQLREKRKIDRPFKSNSDSEIVLHLYQDFGVNAFELLNGMFSIVIWDLKNKELILARDRLGIKPLYYAKSEELFLFGSELKALLMHPNCSRELNWSDLYEPGLQDKEDISSYVEGIYHFPAGHYAKYKVQDRSFSLESYWKLTDTKQPPINEYNDPVETYFSLISDSVKLQLMSDVPVGIFLSGGLDSSLLTALAAKQNKNLHCFTVVEKSTYDSGDVEIARQVAKEHGLKFYPVLFDIQAMVENFDLSELEKMICLMESPRFDLEWYYKSELHKAAKKYTPDLKVILLGQGADEFCGGYSKFLGSKWNNWQEYIEHEIEPSLTKSELTSHQVPSRFYNDLQVRRENNKSVYALKMEKFIPQLQFFNLWHEDRTSSFYGIESRVPYLDHRLVEFLYRTPEEMQESYFWNKNLIRKVADKAMPKYPEKHPKVPFYITEDMSPINEFAKAITKNIYTEFKEKYINTIQNCFKLESLESLYVESQKNNLKSPESAWELIELMSIIIFKEFCNEPKAYLAACDHSTTDAYPLVAEDEWERLEEKLALQVSNSHTSWNSGSIINIPDDCEIVNPLTEDEGSTQLALLHKGTQLCRINIPDSMDWVVMLLDAMGRFVNSPKSVSYWSEKTKVPIQDFINITNNLVKGGFLVKL